MTLGMDRDAMKHRRWHNTFLTGAIVFGLAALGDAAGTIYALTASGYASGNGELTAEILVFVVAAALTLACVVLDRRHSRRGVELVAERGHEAWLPAVTESNGEGRVDLDVETARLRPLVLRSMGLALLWMALLVAALSGFGVMHASADKLLKTGVQVSGEVLGVYKNSRSPDTIFVMYPVSEQDRRYTEILWDSDEHYTKGQPITVIFDQADPDHVRTLHETNESEVWTVVLAVGAIAGPFGIALSVFAAVKWRRRYRAVRATGWRIASVTVVPDYPIRKGRHMPDIHVEYRDGTGITLRAASSFHGSVPLKNHPNRLAWIGGTNHDMVVLFPHGRWRKPPYAVPAYALNLRGEPAR